METPRLATSDRSGSVVVGLAYMPGTPAALTGGRGALFGRFRLAGGGTGNTVGPEPARITTATAGAVPYIYIRY